MTSIGNYRGNAIRGITATPLGCDRSAQKVIPRIFSEVSLTTGTYKQLHM